MLVFDMLDGVHFSIKLSSSDSSKHMALSVITQKLPDTMQVKVPKLMIPELAEALMSASYGKYKDFMVFGEAAVEEFKNLPQLKLTTLNLKEVSFFLARDTCRDLAKFLLAEYDKAYGKPPTKTKVMEDGYCESCGATRSVSFTEVTGLGIACQSCRAKKRVSGSSTYL